ncbi:MAG: cation diffusion facilitator family transporter [Pseudomonadota bacterium]
MASTTLSNAEQQRESAISFALLVDSGLFILLILVALASGSLTILAELVRGGLMFLLEIIAFITLRRVHRGRFHSYDYGSGKVEQLANIGVGLGLLIGGLWIISSGLASALSGGSPHTSFGLALAACFAAINLYVNVLAWQKVRAAIALEPSIILEGQLQARWAKVLTSIVVFLVLTLAVLARDPLIVTWLDAIGALVVSYYMVSIALDLLRDGFVDIADRSLDEVSQMEIVKALVDNYDDYERFDGVRTRRAGDRIFVEVSLGFDAALSLQEVDARRIRIEERLRDAFPCADILLRISAEEAA